MRELHYDVVIVGCGVGGLYTALNLPEDKQILMLSKAELETCDSMLAQGGICVLRDEDDYDSYFEDTMRAGHYENRKESVDIMIRGSRDVINDLIGYGVQFERNEDGSLAYTKEGAHSKPRICFHEDITGEEITTHLLSAVKQLKNVTIFEHTTMTDLIEDINHTCVGILAKRADGEELEIYAENTVFATGGIGGQYKHSTNFPILTGDGCEIARKHSVESFPAHLRALHEVRFRHFDDADSDRSSTALFHGRYPRRQVFAYNDASSVCCRRDKLQRGAREEPLSQQQFA